MNYRYRATETFWENFYRLSPSQRNPRAKHGNFSSKILSIHACARTKSLGFPAL